MDYSYEIRQFSQTVSRLRLLVTGFSPQKIGFNPRPVHGIFVMDKVSVRHVFLPSVSFFTSRFHETNDDTPLFPFVTDVL
jgi:hypothetical protein